jgi:hypothetical protein
VRAGTPDRPGNHGTRVSGRKQLIRNFHAGQYFDLFLVSAVSAILLIRLFLHLTGYPQVGGDTLHVAHMLWGGLLMLVAQILLQSYIGRRTHQIAAVIGGLGFGTFIDEVGKFVTQDHDYFYQPAVALMYVTFVLSYLGVRSIHGRKASPEEYLVNALHEIENVAVGDLDREERDRALLYLEHAGPDDPLAASLKELLTRSDLVPTPDAHPVERLRKRAVSFYRSLAHRPEFPKFIVGFFVAQLGLKIVHILAMWFWPQWDITLTRTLPPLTRIVDGLTFIDWLQLASALLSAFFIAVGIVQIRRSRLRSFQMFRRAMLVSIFITQVFMFHTLEWGALTVLMFNLLVLAALNFIVDQESAREASRVQRAGITGTPA